MKAPPSVSRTSWSALWVGSESARRPEARVTERRALACALSCPTPRRRRRHYLRIRTRATGPGGYAPVARPHPYGGRRVLPRSIGRGERALWVAGDESQGTRGPR